MSSWPKTVLIYTDGASRGNPGPCAIGLEIFDKNRHLIYQEGDFLEKYNTNNFAEYKAVIRALKLAVKHQVQEMTLFSDSQFLIRQLNKEYKVKSPNIKPLFEECQKIATKIPKIKWEHISREKNKGADSLANQALDKKYKI